MKKYLPKLLFLFIGLTLAATASYLNAWSGPPSGTTAPDNNVAAPVNISDILQNKAGVLGLGGLSVFGVEQISTTTYSLPSNLSLGVNGAVGATQYCDANGQNCVASNLLASGGGSSVPTGTIQAFNLATCPSGWIPADGTNGTPDLRGYFIRGLNTSATGVDPNRTLDSIQSDAFKSHSHSLSGFVARSFSFGSGSSNDIWDKDSSAVTTSIVGDTETRPKNIALLYCQKDSTSSGGGSSSIDWSNPVAFSTDAPNNATTPIPYKLCTLNYEYIEQSGRCWVTRNSNGTWVLSPAAGSSAFHIGCGMYCYN